MQSIRYVYKDKRWPGLRRPYDSRKWRRLRLDIFQRDNYICQHCKLVCVGTKRFDNKAPECDHIIPVNSSLDRSLWYDPANLQTLCRKCHRIKSEGRAAHKIMPGANESGDPIDSKHPWNERK